MSRHAPIPWSTNPGIRVVIDNVQCFGVPIRDEKSDLVALIVGTPLTGNAPLIATAPALLALAHQYARECGECAGTRVMPDDEPCTECAFIWQTIDKAEGRA